MTILALDTSLAACSVALWRDGAILAHRFEAMARGHAETLVPMIEATRRDAGIDYSELRLVAVTVGPGTFTGIRIGLSAARGLALALGVPVLGRTTLEVLAAGAASEARGDEAILAAIDARRELCYAQAFTGELSPLCPPALVVPEEALAMAGTRPAVVVGSGAAGLRSAAGATGALRAAAAPELPDAADLARLAAAAPEPTPGEVPAPLYLRPPDARLPGEAGRP